MREESVCRQELHEIKSTAYDNIMLDNDQRLKTVFMRRFAEAIQGFFGPWTQDIDPTEPEFLKNDLFPNPPGGERKAVDILAKVKLISVVSGKW
jgi:hypothetical protein